MEKKGMSKGCMVAIIVVGVILVLVIAGAVTCWMKKDDLAKFGVQTIVNTSKEMLAKSPVEGIDTAQFNTVIDEFLVKFNNDTLNFEQCGLFLQQIQPVIADNRIDSSEVFQLYDAMIDFYPELEELLPEEESSETEEEESYNE